MVVIVLVALVVVVAVAVEEVTWVLPCEEVIVLEVEVAVVDVGGACVLEVGRMSEHSPLHSQMRSHGPLL